MAQLRPLIVTLFAATTASCSMETRAEGPVAVGLVVDDPPPLPLAPEDPPPPPLPFPDAVWIRSQYRWDGSQYVMEHGHYEKPPLAGALYIPGRWQLRAGKWLWIDAHWI